MVKKIVRKIPRQPSPSLTGLEGMIQSLSYSETTKISIPGMYSTVEVSFGATITTTDPEPAKTRLVQWVTQVIEEVSKERLQYWTEQIKGKE
jgi:hypothetical protein